MVPAQKSTRNFEAICKIGFILWVSDLFNNLVLSITGLFGESSSRGAKDRSFLLMTGRANKSAKNLTNYRRNWK